MVIDFKITLDFRLKAILLFILILYFSNSFSQSISTDRPSAQTDNSTTLHYKAFQIESGVILPFTENELNSISVPNLLLRYGILEKIEVRFSTDLMFNSKNKETFISPIQFGSKIQIIKNEEFQLAFVSMLTIQSKNSDSLKSFYENIVTKIVGGNKISDKISLGYTFGHDIIYNAENEFNYSILIGNSISEKFSGFIEFYGNWQYMLDDKNKAINFDFGVSYLLNKKMQVDAYFGRGLNNNSYFASIGFSYLFMR